METKEKSDTTTKLETPINGGAALAKPDAPVDQALAPVAGAAVIVWTRDRVELIKRQICPAGITDDEFAIFIEQCKRTGLDPLIKEAFCVPRRVKIVVGQDGRGYDVEKWVTKHEFQPAESGMAARADRFPDFRGIQDGAVYENDVCEIDHSAGTVRHVARPHAKDRGKLVGAWAIVYREGRKLPVEWVDYEEFVQLNKDGKPTSQWSQKPEVMIVKCARAAAYRRAYPNTFGGLRIEEETPEEKEVNAPPRTEEQEKNGGKSRTERLTEKVQQRAEPVARFGGPLRGKKLSELTDAQLSGLIDTGNAEIAKAPNEKWVPGIKSNLGDIEAEIAKRQAAAKAQTSAPPAAATPPQTIEDAEFAEPGSDNDELPFS